MTRAHATVFAPGPKEGFFLGSLPRLAREGLHFYERLAAEHGSVARFRLGPYRMHLVSAPELVKEVLLHDGERFHKGFGNRALRPLVGNGLFLAEGADWKQKRSLVQPLFRSDHVSQMTSLVCGVARETLERLDVPPDPGAIVDVHPLMREITLRVVSRALVGTDAFDAPESRRLLEWLWVETNRRLTRGLPWLDSLPLPSNLRFRERLAALEAVVHGAIDAKPRAEAFFDLLALLSGARSKAGTALTRREKRDEVMTLLLAGHECTAIALSWTLHLIASNPLVEQRVREELRATLGDRDPAPEDLPKLVYLRQTLDEGMRLFPPAWIVARDAAHDLDLGEYRIPRGQTVLVCAWTLHRDPRFWRDPLRFDPERFAPGAPPPVPYSYLPFGAGPRSCVGRPFAISQSLAVLAMALRRFRFIPLPGPAPLPEPGLTLRPHGGLPLRLAAIHSMAPVLLAPRSRRKEGAANNGEGEAFP